jgi:cell division protein FtsL
MNFKLSITILLVFLVLMITHLFIYTQNISLKYRITDLKVKLAGLNNANRMLSIQVAGKENLARVENIAREKLGMFYPEKIIYIAAGSREVAPAPATK